MSSFRPVHPAWVTLQRIGGLITLAIVGSISGIGAAGLMFSGTVARAYWWAPPTTWGLLILLLIYLGLIYPALAYRRLRYRVDDAGIVIKRGLFFRHVIHVPRHRVQHTDVTQGPIERRFGLATLLMHTAGTTNHTVSLGGLPFRTAMQIRDHFLHENGTSDDL